MSEENKNQILVPSKDEATSAEQKELMLLLNNRVCALFDEKNDILLYPSPEMNKKERWVHLKLIKANPQAHVGYWLENKTCADDTGYLWLNIGLTLWVTDGDGKEQIALLTPNQTHWIFDGLKENEMLRKQLGVYVHGAIANLQSRLIELDKTVETGDFWSDKSKWNPVFDVATLDARRRGYYTSWDIFMENVCPPPPWLYPYPALQYSWEMIREIGKRPLI